MGVPMENKTGAPPILLENVTKTYRKSHLGRTKVSRGIEDVTMVVQRQEVFGLLGLNGSGKTTTIKLLLGILFPTKGRVELFGSSAADPSSRRSIGYLPEVSYFYRHLSAQTILRYYGRLSGLDEKTLDNKIQSTLAVVHMDQHKSRPLREFSKGMLQRIALAQALLHDPEILLLDEPVTGLDPLGLKEMRELMAALNAQGKTILFSSHSISEVEKLCHRVAILVQGRLMRVAERSEWESSPGALEKIFVDTVTASGAAEVGQR
jgi:ABC-2 type transport system ATP-binding protein